MSQPKKRNKESFLGYLFTIIALLFIIGFPFFAHEQNKIIVENNINAALKSDGTKLTSYTFEHKKYDHPQTRPVFPIKEQHSSLYQTFYKMFDLDSEIGNNKIYEVTGNNGEKYEVDINRKLQVVDWHKL